MPKKSCYLTLKKNPLGKITKQNKNKAKVPPLCLESLTTQQQEIQAAPTLVCGIPHIGLQHHSPQRQQEQGQPVTEVKAMLKTTKGGLEKGHGAQ